MCCHGPPGQPGIPGVPGTSGGLGPAGPSGSKGDRGEFVRGEKGDRGGKGEPGNEGSKGNKGSEGSPGKQGPLGQIGPQGLHGNNGSKGEKGESPEVRKSAFTAVRTTHVPTSESIILFTSMEINVGEDFDKNTGKFTCRISGFYYFMFSFLSMNGNSPYVKMKLNGRDITTVQRSVTSGYDQLSSGATVQLNVSDEVWLTNEGGQVYGNSAHPLTFTGFMYDTDRMNSSFTRQTIAVCHCLKIVRTNLRIRMNPSLTSCTLLIGLISLLTCLPESLSTTTTPEKTVYETCNMCCHGPPGQPGIPGVPGISGGLGPAGPSGSKGDRGEFVRGENGDGGKKGEPGNEGSKGKKGNEGSPGKQGPLGQIGPQGLQGNNGSKGEKGESPEVRKSAFTAVRTSSVPTSESIILFTSMEINVGEDFDKNTGKFTCRISGFYYFMFSFLSQGGIAPYVKMKLNGRAITTVHRSTAGGSDQLSSGATVQLNVGDEVWLTNEVFPAQSGLSSNSGILRIKRAQPHHNYTMAELSEMLFLIQMNPSLTSCTPLLCLISLLTCLPESLSTTTTPEKTVHETCNMCCHGPPGQPGIPGVPGTSGGLGPAGPSGSKGDRGEFVRGEKGDGGKKGEPGNEGSKGNKGNEGSPGKQGPLGQIGPQGLQGNNGSKGEKGESPEVRKSAFTAERTTYVLTSESIILFTSMEINIGEDFDKNTGKFTCRISGFYYFMFSFLSQTGHAPYVKMKLNGRDITTVYRTSTSGHDQLSSGATVQLNVSDEVWLTNEGRQVHGSLAHPLTFTGFMVYDMN
ncbi:uncharacterized protein LOC117117498 [Anneissia japonica]|uniref:uncharacterized protein LOC117117498 n=1 Tax=Anneissia japonica TaxID=1529436 RepID=UPI0014254BB4|nr:uncharacterized protein LOC117117498 [Anneissia japonica]